MGREDKEKAEWKFHKASRAFPRGKKNRRRTSVSKPKIPSFPCSSDELIKVICTTRQRYFYSPDKTPQ
jgi:hypothetical protein